MRRACLLLFLALGATALPAQAPSTPAAPPGEVSGLVTDAQTGAALNDAVVTLQGTRFGATTRADGAYRLRGVPAGSYTLRVRRIGYSPATREVVVPPGATAPVDLGLVELPVALDEIVTTGSATGIEARSLPGAVTIVDAGEIETRGIVNTEDVFKTVPGVSLLKDGQFKFQSTVTIRGGNSLYGNTAKILVDGVPAASDYSLNDIDPATIERIEVFRGPQASTIYGSAASGGLIAVTTKKGEFTNSLRPALEATVSTGVIETPMRFGRSVLTTDNLLAVNGGGTGFSYRVGGRYTTQGNWVPNGYERSPSLFGGLRVTQGTLVVEANARYLTRDFGWLYDPRIDQIAPSFAIGALNQTDELDVDRQQAYNLHAIYQATPDWTHDVTAGFDQNTFEWWSRRPLDSLGTGYYANYTTQTPSLRYRMGLNQHLGARLSSALTLGADYSSSRSPGIYWQGVGNPESGYMPIDSTTQQYSSINFLYSKSAYAQEILGVGENLFLTLGLRADNERSTYKSVPWAWSPRAGIAYSHVFGGLEAKLRTSYGTVSSPIPYYALIEQPSSGFVVHANPGIRPQRLTGADVGLELYFGRRGSLVVTYYNQKPKDQIDFVTLQQDSIFATPAGDTLHFVVGQYQNVGTIRNRGFEFEGTLALGRLTLSANYSPVSGKLVQLSRGYGGTLQVGDRLFNVPSWTASITASYALPHGSITLTATPTGSHRNYSLRRLYADYEAGTYDPALERSYYQVNYPGFTKFSLSASHQVTHRVQAFLSVQDLFNAGSIETYDLSITKGRVSTFGFKVRPQ